MSEITVTEVLALPDDRLLVRGTAEGYTQTVSEPVLNKDGTQKVKRGTAQFREREVPVVFTAQGWRSALQNHYPPEAYDGNGDLKLKPHPKSGRDEPNLGDPEHDAREMTDAEKLGYCRSLLEAVIEAQPKPLPIKG